VKLINFFFPIISVFSIYVSAEENIYRPPNVESGSNCPNEVLESFRSALNDFGESASLARRSPRAAAAVAGNVIGKVVNPSFAPMLQTSTSQLQNLACGSLNVQDLRNLDSTCSPDFRRPLKDLAAVASESVESMFFQELASNSHKQSICRIQLLGGIRSDEAKYAGYKAKALQAFNSIKNDVADLQRYISEQEAHISSLNSDYRYTADRAMSAMRAQIVAQTRTQIEEARELMTRLVIKVPLGYEPEVAMALQRMAIEGRFDDDIMKNAIFAAEKKHNETDIYYRGKAQYTDNGQRMSYCLGTEYKEEAGRTGQIHRLLTELPLDQNLKNKISCRIDAEYVEGVKIYDTAETVVMIGGMAFGGAGLVFRGLTLAPRLFTAAGFIGRGMEAVGLVAALDEVQKTCYPRNYAISGDRNICNVELDYEKVIKEFDGTACAISLGVSGLSAVGVPSHIRNWAARRNLRPRTDADDVARVNANAADEAIVARNVKPSNPATRRATGSPLATAANDNQDIVVTARSSPRLTDNEITRLEARSLRDKARLDELISSRVSRDANLINQELNAINAADGNINQFFVRNPGFTNQEQNRIRNLFTQLQRERAQLTRNRVRQDLDRVREADAADVDEIDCNVLNTLNTEPAFHPGARCSRIKFNKDYEDYCSCGAAGRLGAWAAPCANAIDAYRSIPHVADISALPVASANNLDSGTCKRLRIRPGTVVFHGGLNPTMSGYGGGSQIFIPSRSMVPPTTSGNVVSVGSDSRAVARTSRYMDNRGALDELEVSAVDLANSPPVEVIGVAPITNNAGVREIYNLGRQCSREGVCTTSPDQMLARFNQIKSTGAVSSSEERQFLEWLDYFKGCRTINAATGALSDLNSTAPNCRR
jgi:hypothetical protein